MPYSSYLLSNRENTVRKPQPIFKYNAHMSGVDRADQMLSYNSCQRKTLRWYKKIFVHVLQMLLLNAHKLFNNHYPTQSLYDFRLSVIRNLLPAPPQIVVEGPGQKRLCPGPSQNVLKTLEKNNSNRIERKDCRTSSKYKKEI